MHKLKDFNILIKIITYIYMFTNTIRSELTVFSIGDWGENTTCFNNITKRMETLSKVMNPEFIISAGDNFYPNGVSSVDDNKWYTLLENPFSIFEKKLKIHSCLGDHDWRGNTYSQILRTSDTNNSIWYLPGYWWYEIKEFNAQNMLSPLIEKHVLENIMFNKSDENSLKSNNTASSCDNDCINEVVDNLNVGVNVNNSLDNNISFKTLIYEYENVVYPKTENITAIFIYLDSYLLSQDPFKKTSISHRDLQLEFLETTLKASIYNGIDWIVLVTHYSIFSSGYHGPQRIISKYLLPLIKKYRVDYVISGHDHHSEFLRYEDTNSNFYIVGASSKPRSGFAKTHEYSIFKTDLCSFTSFTFSKDIAVASIFGLELPFSTSFKKSNKYTREKMKIEPTEFPNSSSNIKLNRLFNIFGWTLSISVYS